MDRRQQKTRQAIFESFSALLETKNYVNITVQEIIDKANVGRSTFYAHFETKDELLRAMCNDIFQHVFSEHLQREAGHDFSVASHGLKQEITHILYHLQENHNNLKGILTCESGDLFMHFFQQYLADMFTNYIQPAHPDVPQEYILNHIVCSFAETVRWWITEHAQYTPEEIAEFFLASTPESFLSAWDTIR